MVFELLHDFVVIPIIIDCLERTWIFVVSIRAPHCAVVGLWRPFPYMREVNAAGAARDENYKVGGSLVSNGQNCLQRR
jgi:hypothetical protein